MNERQQGACALLASTSWGHVRLWLSPGEVVQSAGLIRYLRQWCGVELAFAPEPANVPESKLYMRGRVADARLAPMGTLLELPVALLQSVSPPLPLQGAAIQWNPLTCWAVLAELDADALNPIHASAGGMVLLPPSFQSPWTVRLQTLDGQYAMAGHLQLEAGLIELVGKADAFGPKVSGARNSAWQVRLSRGLAVDVPAAMGWHASNRVVPVHFSCSDDAEPEIGLAAQACHVSDGRTLRTLSGMVVPVMSGAALSIHEVHSHV